LGIKNGYELLMKDAPDVPKNLELMIVFGYSSFRCSIIGTSRANPQKSAEDLKYRGVLFKPAGS